MTDDLNPISVENQSSESSDDFTTEIGMQPQAQLSDDGEFAFATGDTKDKNSFNTLWQNLRRIFFPTRTERENQLVRRISRLSNAIELYPDSPTNYTLRGELFLETGDYELAAEDFRRALELAIWLISNPL